MPLAVLREWFDVRPTVLTVDTAAIGDPQVLAISDPDDVPTGQLAELIAPCVLFSEDRHLRKPSLAPPGMARGGPVRRRPGGRHRPADHRQPRHAPVPQDPLVVTSTWDPSGVNVTCPGVAGRRIWLSVSRSP